MHLGLGRGCSSEGDPPVHIDSGSNLHCNGDLEHKTREQEGKDRRHSTAKDAENETDEDDRFVRDGGVDIARELPEHELCIGLHGR